MRIFLEISPVDVEDALVAAAEAIVKRAVALPEPRSLCEIQPDEEDYQWLCDWASQLTSRQLQRWIDGINSRRIVLQESGLNLSYGEAAGCLLLLLASEAARRRASEGYVWPTVRGLFAKQAGNLLFVQGQPRSIFKDAIEASARKLGLRHVFGVEGTHNYYLSVYLQFGFTRKGMDRLAYWLAGQPSTQAVMYLLGDPDEGMGSKSFTRLWDALRNYRRNNITESQARQTLVNNPWTLPDWTDELLNQSRRHPEMGTAELGQTGRGEQLPPQFLEMPRLRWNWPESPRFSSAVVNLADFDLDSERYFVKVGSTTLTTLVATDDGTYSSHPPEIALPSGSPEFVASLVDDSGSAQTGQLLELWDPKEDVAIFNLRTGRRLDAWEPKRVSGREYGLLASIDLEVEPLDLQFHEIGIGDNAKRLYLLPQNIDRHVRVSLSGEEIWNSGIDGGAPPKSPEPDWARMVTATILPTDRIRLDRYEGSSVRVSGLGSDAELLYVRFGGRPLGFNLREDGDYLTEEFDITKEAAAGNSLTLPEIKVKLGLRLGSEQVSVERTQVASVSGILRASDTGWQVVNRQDKLTVNEARQATYKVLLPGYGQDADTLALLEGPIFLKKLWRHPRPLGQLGGYGAPLELRPPYNFTRFKMVVSEEVRDPGIFEGVLAGENANIRLFLRHPLEPGSKHKIVLWNIGAPPVILDAIGNVEHRGDEWDMSCPGTSFDDGFLALAYDGARVGSLWPGRPEWPSSMGSGDAAEISALLKWMHAPIVAPEWLDGIRSFAQKYPGPALSAWLLDKGLPSSLSHGTTDEEQWRASVRQVFSGWNPDGESAWEVISALGEVSADGTASEALQVLLQQDPLLMGRLLKVWNGSPDLTFPGGATAKRDLIYGMRFLIAGLPVGSTDLQWGQQEQQLLDHVATLMSVDENFVRQGIVRRVLGPLDYNALNDVDRNNVEVALTTAPFREYLGLRVLSSLL